MIDRFVEVATGEVGDCRRIRFATMPEEKNLSGIDTEPERETLSHCWIRRVSVPWIHIIKQ